MKLTRERNNGRKDTVWPQDISHLALAPKRLNESGAQVLSHGTVASGAVNAEALQVDISLGSSRKGPDLAPRTSRAENSENPAGRHQWRLPLPSV